MPDPQGPEPTGWELMRGIEGLREEIRTLGGRVVSQDTYNADKKGIDDRFVRIEAEVDAFHTSAAERDRTEAAQRTENERSRKSTQLAIALAVASPIIAIVVNIVFRGFGGGA